jgi:two-component system OmpR family response regulator
MTMMTSTAPGSRPGCAGRPARILVVDDEASLAELLTLTLSYEGWDVRSAADGTTALATAAAFTPDAVLLDMMLPDMEGTEVLHRLHAARPDLPVLFLTARDSPEDRAAGLLAGADAYLTKPFSLDDVVARMHSLLGSAGSPVLVAGDLELSVESRTVRRGGATIALTGTEFEVLRQLLLVPGAAVAGSDLGARLPGGRASVLALCLAALRRKLGVEITAVTGGYRLER